MVQKKKILIVDDSGINRMILSNILSANYIILEAKNGKEALEIVEKEKRDLSAVLLDLFMPVLNGYEFLKQTRSLGKYNYLPILVMTQNDDDNAELRALELGANDFLKKPFNSAIIKQRVHNIIFLSESAAMNRAMDYHVVTGIYTKEKFYDATAKLLQENKDTDYVLVRWDIDRFKVINALFSKEMGDDILMRVGQGLKSYVMGIGTFGHLESDHFIMCIPKALFDDSLMVQKMDVALGQYQSNYRIVTSFGIYEIVDKTMPIHFMSDRANMALRTVKGNSMNRVGYYNDTIRENLLEEQEIISEMNEALKKGEFDFFLQPIFSLKEKKPVSAEALVRWNHPTKGRIDPQNFIPLFERNGFIMHLDAYVWELVCKFLRQQKCKKKQVLPISVNISRADFYNINLCNEIIALVEKYEIEPSLLLLEITESAYTESPKDLLASMKTLQDYGFKIYMDDFGSGYSSLNMLKDVPVDVLKIDLDFMDDFSASPRAASVITSIVRMAKWLDIPVVAEGVENQEQLDFLKSIGCSRVQGYYFARPMSIADFEEFVDDELGEGLPLEILKESTITFGDLGTNQSEIGFVVDSMKDGFGICEYLGDTLELIRYNQGFYKMMSSLCPESGGESTDIFRLVIAEDLESMRDCCLKARNTKKWEKVLVRFPQPKGLFLWAEMGFCYRGLLGDTAAYYFSITDITSQKTLEADNDIRSFVRQYYGDYDAMSLGNILDQTLYPILSHSDLCPLSYSDFDEKFRFISDDVFPEKDRLLFESAVGELRNHSFSHGIAGVAKTLSLQMAKKDATYCPVIIRLIPYMDIIGRRYLLCCISLESAFTSISKTPYETMLSQYESVKKRLEMIVKHKALILFEWDFTKKQFYASEGYIHYNISHYQPEDVIRNTASLDIMHPNDVALFLAFLENAKVSKAHEEVTLRLKMTDNTYRWTSITGGYLMDETGAYLSLAGSFQDREKQVSEIMLLKKKQKANAQEIKVWENLFNNVPCGIIWFTMENNPSVLDLNDACWQILKYDSRKEFFNTIHGNLFDMVYPEDQSYVREVIHACVQSQKPQQYDFRIFCKNGIIGHIRGVLNIASGIGEKPIIQGVYLDMTENAEQVKMVEEYHRQNEFYRMVVEESDQKIFDYDMERDSISYSLRMPDDYRAKRKIENFSSFLSESMIVHPDYKATIWNTITSCKKQPSRGAFEMLADFYELGYRWYRVEYKSISYNGLNVTRCIGRIVDIQDEQEAKSLLAEEKAYRNVLMEDSLFVVSLNTASPEIHFIHSSAKAKRDFYLFSDYELFDGTSEFVFADDFAAFHDKFTPKAISAMLKKNIKERKAQFRIQNKKGSWIWVEANFYLVKDNAFDSGKCLCYIREIDEYKRLADSLKSKAEIDAVSQIFNRGTVTDRVEAIFAGEGKDMIHGFILMDIDNFKEINDTKGHIFGDEVLRKVGVTMKQCFRKSDVIGRIGGDEFVVFLKGIVSENVAKIKVKELSQELRKIEIEENGASRVTVTLGIAFAPRHGTTFKELYAKADIALYKGKDKGKNCYQIYQDI